MEQKHQIAEKLQQTNNILVTVSKNPSVDQLASCIGLTILLNKMGKSATAVFSGKVPSTIEFLQPEKTLKHDVDSLRDFIISLDKAKADKLRYKVEDKVVKIFITPWHTSLSGKDLEFSQGDFNVEAVVALGVSTQADIDQAIAAHGRILHDAAVMTMHTKPGGEFGSINWINPTASSLCEMVADMSIVMDKQSIDGQIATSFLTGIVAETDRFSNKKTAPATMSISATLMASGANQQLVVTKLEEAAHTPPPPPPKPVVPVAPPAPVTSPTPPTPPAPKREPGELQIRQTNDTPSQPVEETVPIQPPAPQKPVYKPEDEESRPVVNLEDLANSNAEEEKDPDLARIHIDDKGDLHTVGEALQGSSAPTTDPITHMGSSRMVVQPPSASASDSAPAGEPSRNLLPTPPAPTIPGEELPSGAPAPHPTDLGGFQSAAASSPSGFVSTHAEKARSAVVRAFGGGDTATPTPPDLTAPAPEDMPGTVPPMPSGPPPPAPPPMMPQ